MADDAGASVATAADFNSDATFRGIISAGSDVDVVKLAGVPGTLSVLFQTVKNATL